jgi:hypothetical protein
MCRRWSLAPSPENPASPPRTSRPHSPATLLALPAQNPTASPRGREHDVPRFQIPVHHSAAMRLVQCIRDLRAVFQYLIERQRLFLQPLRQRFPFHALHHQIVHAILRTNVVQNTNVRVIQSRNGLGFPFESLLPHRITRKLLRKNFDRHVPPQPRIPRAIHLSHPARTQRPNDLIRSKLSTRGEDIDAGIMAPVEAREGTVAMRTGGTEST